VKGWPNCPRRFCLNSTGPFDVSFTSKAIRQSSGIANHGFTLEAIDRSEEEDLTSIQKGFELENHDTITSMMAYHQTFYDDLRQAARRLALVALVTRLQHWTERFVAQLKVSTSKGRQSKLARQLETLNNRLGVGPVPVVFFENIVTVRDSVIHGDSRAEWEFDGPRRVADEYRNPSGDVELTDDQLKESIQKAIQQVKWYDEKMDSLVARP
jgi:hypothetical protein